MTSLVFITLANAITMLIDLATLYLAVRLFAGGGRFRQGYWSPASRGRLPSGRFSGMLARLRRWSGFFQTSTRNQKLALVLVLLFVLRCLFAVNIRIGA